LPILAWPICAILGYRLGIRSKTKDIAMRTCEEIRNSASELIDKIEFNYINRHGETLYQKMGNNPQRELNRAIKKLEKSNNAVSFLHR